MEGKSIILDLFNEGISFAERLSPQNSEYHSIVSKEEQKMNALKDKLNAEQLKALEEFLAIKNRYDAIYIEETFRQGVAFGVKFTAEVCLLGE